MKKEKKVISNILNWWDNNLLTILAGFLLIFLPLYPKIPLFDILPGYIVRVRIEDFLILFTILVWFIWLIRGKISLGRNPLFKPVVIYLVIGLLSVLSAVFIIQTVPFEFLHVQKTLLHYFRRIEYFSLFFILFSAVRSIKDVKRYIFIIFATLVLVNVYGFGQKYLYWPAFSTMNREFSKGWLLYLTEHSRVLSTFGGHYDLAAYLMMALTFCIALFFAYKKTISKLAMFVIIAASFWLLILTASRTSFLAYLAGASVVVLLWVFKKNLGWVFTRWFAVIFLSVIFMLSFGDLSDRFTKLLKLDQRFGGLKNVLLRPATNPPPEKAVFLVNNLNAVTSKSDQPPTTVKPGSEVPVDVTGDTTQPILDEETGETIYVERTYSNAALQYDLSTGIRLDALWPRAIAGFTRNPLLGSGYATLTKTNINEFTEAESTDNDYLRMLGETGALGTIAFLGIIVIAVITIWKSLGGIEDPVFYAVCIATIGLTAGMLVNAVYIDVFEASKVAYVYWAFLGLTLGGIHVSRKEIEKDRKPLKIPFDFPRFRNSFLEGIRSDKFLLTLVLIAAFYVRLYRIDNPIADWHSWRQSDTAAVTRNYIKQGGINFLYPTFDDLSSIPSGQPNPRGLRMVEFPIYNAVSVIVKYVIPEGPLERSMRLTSIFFSLGSIVFLFRLTKKYINRRTGYITSILFAILPYNIYFSRVILPEPTLVFFILGTLYFFDCFFTLSKFKYFVLCGLFAAAAFLIKPFAAFFFLPIIYLGYRKYRLKIFSQKELYLLALIIILPFIFWRVWISNFPEGIPAYQWLLNGDGIRFKGAFFQWIFADRIGRLILGYWGLPLLVLGILVRPAKAEGWFFRFLGIGSLIYLFVIATGNVRHDYYQTMIIPAVVVFVAKGIDYLLSFPKDFPKPLSIGIAILCVLFMEAFGWYQIRDFFNINHQEIVEAGKAVDENTHRYALVIAPYGGDTAFLYQTNRSGWPIVENSIDYLIKNGADYYVGTNFDDQTNKLLEIAKDPYNSLGYKVIKKTDNYVLIRIVPENKLPKD
ncbi:glycosyltransferase family 39 protein [Candidatus Gottesmanbacteria bacterium]|nr:glycosyltransferase family 39 protein [Candidatus Gottesmanbacteria bacterium]